MRLRDMQSGASPPSDCREQVQRTASASLWTALSNRMPRHLRLLNPMGAWGVSDEAGGERERGKEREDPVSVCVWVEIYVVRWSWQAVTHHTHLCQLSAGLCFFCPRARSLVGGSLSLSCVTRSR